MGNIRLFVMALSLLALPVARAEVKLAVVDMQKALQTVDSGKKAKENLESEFNRKKKDLEKEEAEIKNLHAEFQKQSAVLNEKARVKKQEELQERIMKFQQKTQKSQVEIQKKEQELTEPIIGKIRKIIKDLADKKGYTMVFERNDNNVLYFSPADDLTNEVISAFNKEK